MIKNKHIVQFVAVLLCATLLTFTAGRVTRVKAVVTEAAVIGGVALIVGTAFLGYLALTGAYVQYTDIDTRNDYVTDVGKWVIENCNGIGISKLIAQASDWVGRQALSAGSFAIEYTKDLISDFYNSFNNIKYIINGVSVDLPENIFVPSTTFDYSPYINYSFLQSNFSYLKNPVSGVTYEYNILKGFTLYTIAYSSSYYANYAVVNSYLPLQINAPNLVNYLTQGQSQYKVGFIQGNKITPLARSVDVTQYTPICCYQNGILVGATIWDTGSSRDGTYAIDGRVNLLGEVPSALMPTYNVRFPVIANKETYLCDAEGNIISQSTSLAPTDSTSVSFPNTDENSDIYPMIPFVPFPDSPNNSNGFWGTFVDDILDGILDGLETALIAALIDEFTNDNGGDSILYDDDVTNYYYYYDIKNDIKQQSEELPIDLNEISLYTDNTYLTTLKESVGSVSDVIHDYVGFWYDVDPTVVIIILGSAVLSVVTLLLHKMGG